MKISKLSGDYSENDWLGNFALPVAKTKVVANNATVAPSVAPLSNASVEEITDDVLAEECEKIEHCASTGTNYRMNIAWGAETKAHLKEYAMACGLDNSLISEISPQVESKPAQSVVEKQEQKLVVTASTKTKTLDLGDPFKIEERSDTSHMDARNWQVNTPAQKMASNPVMNSGIVPVRGGENYLIQNSPKLAENQNSIVNPNAIEQMVNSKELDNGQRLAMEQAEKAANKVAQKKQWEQDVIDAMVFKDIVAKGKVFPTEMLNAQTGLGSPASQRIANKFDPANVEEKTEGEKIREQNQERHAAISRPKEEFNWEEARPDTSRGVSDLFGESLKKAMRK